ncbi:MAG TPA: ATP-binding protein [Actinomycetota bacterium]|nr:ATP-binding protein [Actinomycetota bacterium]
MSRRTAAVVAWGSLGGSALLVVLAIVVTASNGPVPPSSTSAPDLTLSVPATVAFGFILLTYAGVGALIMLRRPDNGVGWLFCANGVLLAFFNLAGALEGHGLVTNPGSVAGAAWFGLLSDALWVPFIAATTVFLFLFFPEGRPVGRGRRVAATVAAVAVATATVGGLLESHLYGLNVANPLWPSVPRHLDDVLILPGFIALLGALLWSMGNLVRRLRRATGDERLQLRWFAWAAGLVLVIFVPSTLIAVTPFAWQVLGSVALILLPVAVGIAILQYRLYDIDVVISKTVVYAALAAFITLVYVAIVVVLGGAIGAANGNLGLAIVATAIVALAFEPLRERLQRFANRLVYGERATPYEVLSRFSDRVAGTYANEDILPRTARVIAEGTGADRADVWLRLGDQLVLGATWPPGGPDRDPVPIGERAIGISGADRTETVRYHDEQLGAITITKPPGEPVSPAEDKLLSDLSSQAGVVLSNVRLTADLEARLEQISRQAVELRASRQRIVAAQDAERRRLERNIHDGAQQHLVALAVKLRLVRGLIRTDPGRARAMVEELRGQIDLALDTLNALSLGIYPPLLEEQGIAAALAAQYVRTPLPVHLDADGLRRYPIETEAAVYFCCLEALQNAAKYARATRIDLRLRDRDGAIVFEVEDDGVGFDPATTPNGTGLVNMNDRLSVLGGSAFVSSEPGAGTVVQGRVPVEDLERMR